MTTPTTSTTPTEPVTESGSVALRVLGVEIGEGLRAIRREPTTLFFAVLMPVGFFALLTSIFGQGDTGSGLTYGTTALATYGAFGVVSVMLLTPGQGVADDRSRGWLRVKKVSAAPLPIMLAARVVAALPYAVGVLLAMSAVSLAVAGPVLDVGTWLRLVVVLVLGSLPFALLGMAVGFVATSNATAAVLNAVFFPMSIASGLWFPLEALPGFLQAIAPFLPTFHLSRVALAQLAGEPATFHLVVLLLMTAVAAGLAGLAYRNLRV